MEPCEGLGELKVFEKSLLKSAILIQAGPRLQKNVAKSVHNDRIKPTNPSNIYFRARQ